MDEQVIDSGATTDTQETTDTGTQDLDAVTGQPSDSGTTSETGTTTQPTAKQVADIIDWQKDERYKRMWKGNPNELYKSYKNLEKTYDPLKKQYGVIESTFKELGIPLDPNQLRELHKEYNSLKSPDNPANQVYNSLLELLQDDEITAQEFQLAMDKIAKDKEMRKYPGVSDDVRRRLIEQEKEHKELKTWKEQLEQKEKYTQEVASAKSGWEKSIGLAKSKGFEWSDDIANNVLSYMDKNKIDSRYVYHTFLELYGEQLDKNFAERTEKSVMERLNKNKSAAVVGANASAKKVSDAPKTGRDAMKAGFSKALEKMGFN